VDVPRGVEAPLVGAGVIGALIAGAGLRRVHASLEPERRRWFRFWGLGCLLSLLPVLATFPANRLLLFPTLGGFALIAMAIEGLPAALGRGGRIAAGVLILLHAVLPPISWLIMPGPFGDMGRRTLAVGAEMEVDHATLPEKRVLLLSAPDAAVGIYGPIAHRHVYGTVPRAWWVLMMAPHDARVTRTASNALELQVERGRLLDTLWEQLFRAEDRPLSVGEEIPLEGAHIRILATEGPYPTRVRFELEHSLDDEGLVLLRWEGGRLRKVAPPPIGEALALPTSPGPMTAPY
jgi:hypothetical protein